ncbi:PadR family transcriptional regulator [Lawsonibacter celer]|uniref:PadR family transcriptional regulator n=1 Tax=Lawsonibacter celer TaxID=2986526 RepID=UPI0016492C69|nr:PadR family transcriptional regulator [Lawsonibacter celer]
MGRKMLETLTESMLYVLMALLREERCGTEIADFVSAKTGGRVRLGPGTLYTILAKFQEEALIQETAVEGRRRTYALTQAGRARYWDEVARLRACIADAEEEERLWKPVPCAD